MTIARHVWPWSGGGVGDAAGFVVEAAFVLRGAGDHRFGGSVEEGVDLLHFRLIGGSSVVC